MGGFLVLSATALKDQLAFQNSPLRNRSWAAASSGEETEVAEACSSLSPRRTRLSDASGFGGGALTRDQPSQAQPPSDSRAAPRTARGQCRQESTRLVRVVGLLTARLQRGPNPLSRIGAGRNILRPACGSSPGF